MLVTFLTNRNKHHDLVTQFKQYLLSAYHLSNIIVDSRIFGKCQNKYKAVSALVRKKISRNAHHVNK